jgi:hypothetical protein
MRRIFTEGVDVPPIEFKATRAHGRARCPFCAGEYEVGTLTDGRAGLTHTMPPCENFVRLGVIEYLRAARLAGAKWITYHPDLD